MRHVVAFAVSSLVVGVAVVSPPARKALADDAAPAQAPSPAPTPSPPPAPSPSPAPTPTPTPHPADCAACVQCVGACATAYADCTRKCVNQPDFPSQQSCVAQCPPPTQCAQACNCAGCVGVPGVPH